MIGGNTTIKLQVKTQVKNSIGERVPAWHDVVDLTGFLDLSGGDSKHNSYNAKIQESTHVFICDYEPVPDTLEIEGKTVKVKAENCRVVANTERYDVMLIDNPMNLNKHLEIFLKYTGGQ